MVESPKDFVLDMFDCIAMKKPKTVTNDIQLILTKKSVSDFQLLFFGILIWISSGIRLSTTR